MCIVSAVHQSVSQISINEWSKDAYQEYLKMKEAAERFDKLTNQPNCIDPAKEKLVQDIVDYLEKSGKLK